MSAKKKSYIRFEKIEEPGEEAFWEIRNRRYGDLLGTVVWYHAWKCFVFVGQKGVVWSSDCHDEVGAFLKEAKR